MARWTAMVGLGLCLGCGTTTTRVHRPPLQTEVDEIKREASMTERLEVVYDSPAGPLVEQDQGRKVSIDRHKLTFEPFDGPPLVLPTSQIRSVSVVSKGQGVAPGALGGLLAAVVLGLAISTTQERGPDNVHGQGPFLMISAVAVLTVPLGMIAGGSVGRRRTFTLVDEPPRPVDPGSWSP